MKNWVKVDFENGLIIMDRTFAMKCRIVGSEEYNTLQRVRADYPLFRVERRQIKKNPNKETWAGLTYGYMESYIRIHEDGEALDAVMAEYNELKLISKCHTKSRRYAPIKSWFLAKYPEIAQFGLPKDEANEESENKDTKSECTVMQMPQTQNSKEDKKAA